jgi:hypothetical protein
MTTKYRINLIVTLALLGAAEITVQRDSDARIGLRTELSRSK